MKTEKFKSFSTKVLSSLVGLIILASLLGYAIYASMTPRTGYERIADANTMEAYKDELINDTNGSRYAGKVWADKTVRTATNKSSDGNSSLRLTTDDDGYQGSVGYNADFLHVFSTIGSSQVVDQYSSKPIDVVLLLDISSSMTAGGRSGDNLTGDDALHDVIDETNLLIDQLMGKDPALAVHPDNRVGIIVYGGGTQMLLPLGHYSALNQKEVKNKSIGEYIKIRSTREPGDTTDAFVKRNLGDNSTYFPTIKTNVEELQQQNTSLVMIADSTYLQGALYQGMEMLANEPSTTYQDKVQGKVARTPVVITLTDGATNIVSATSTTNGDHNNQFKWYEPFEGVIPNAGDDAIYAKAGANPFYTDCNNNTGTLTENKDEIRNTVENKKIEVQAISTRSVSNLLLAGYYKNKIEQHYKTNMINYSIGYNINETTAGVGPFGREQLIATLNPEEYFDVNREFSNSLNESQKQLAKEEVEATRTKIEDYVNNGTPTMRFPRDPEKTYIFTPESGPIWADFEWDHPKNDIENDVKNFEDIYYINKFYTAEDTQGVSDIFNEIIQSVTEQTFNPIEGENDNGVENSLTYMDPIGEYMEIKDNCITNNGVTTDMSMLLFGEMHGMVKTAVYDYKFNSDPAHIIDTKADEGWYDNETGNFISADQTASNWKVATYRVCDKTARDYVSTLNEDNLTSQQQNTIYTLYRFTEDSDERNKDRYNPSYDEEVIYKLSDIRVWSQYTGDYIDEEGSDSAIDLGYDEALYVNIPNSALPVEIAKISLDQNGGVTSYKTNLEDKIASTPFRLFYGVGVQDSIRTEDGKKIDITKLSPEYINKHTTDGFIEFYSNYYSGSTHSHGNDIKTIGDANFTFSPNSANRYYAFQKPLILYEDNSEEHKDILEVDKDNPYAYTEFLSKKQETQVDSIEQMKSDKNYYIEIEYYLPKPDGTGELVHAVVSRTGSEFGSEIAGDNVSYGEYLVWYNPNDGSTVDYTTKDGGGGVSITPKPGDDYVIATKPQGLRIGKICSNNVEKKPGDGNDVANPTGTAKNAYLALVSDNTTAENVVLNGYLGNNGLLKVKDSSLEITKEVEGFLGNTNYKNQEFDFVLTMPSYANETVDAICIHRNDKYKDGLGTQKWLIQPKTIDVVTTNEGFIQAADVDPELPTTYATTDDGKNYIYIGNSSGENVFNLYNSENDKDLNSGASELENVGKRSTNADDGSIEYYVKKAYLVPVKGFNIENFEAPTDENNQGYTEVKDFVIAKLDATKDLENQIISNKYLTRTAYLTRTLQFNDKGEAMFTLKLKDGEGILLVGLESSTEYTVKEVLTPGQIEDGYRFDHTNIDNTQFDEDGNAYIHDEMGNDYNSRGIHYINNYYMLNDLSINKTVRGFEGNREKEWTFNIRLTFKDDKFVEELKTEEDDDNTITVNVKHFKYDESLSDYKEDQEQPSSTIKLTKSSTNDLIYTGSFNLKHNQKITLEKIPSGTEYEVNEVGANNDGYVTTIKNASGTIGGQQGNVINDINVQCINNKPSKDQNLTIEKQVKGQTADVNANWKFNIYLADPEYYKLDNSYAYEKSDGTNGNLQLTNNQDDNRNEYKYKATVYLKHGESLTIKGLPEGTRYKIEEELGENQETYDVTVQDNSGETIQPEGTIVNQKNEYRKFVNSKIEYYQLALNKLVNGLNGNKEEEFKFKVTFIPSEGYELEPINFNYENSSKEGGKLVFRAEDKGPNDIVLIDNKDGSYSAEILLKDGETIKFDHIIELTKYEIDENLDSNQTGEHGYIKKLSETSSPSSGTIDQGNQNPEVQFVNTRYSFHDLIIRKNVKGGAGDINKNFRFRVTLIPAKDVDFENFTYPYSINGNPAGNLQLTKKPDGSYTYEFTLKHGEYLTINDIPERTQYYVEELDADTDGYDTTVSSTDTEATVSDKDEVNGTLHEVSTEVDYTNTRLARYGLTLQKIVQGENADRNREFTFNITLIPAADVEKLDSSYPYTGSKNGNLQLTDNQDGTYTGTVTLKDGEYITINNIPERTYYIVEELNANQDGYFTRSTNNTQGTLDGTSQSTVIFTNIKTPSHSLTISKEVEGGGGSTVQDWTFEIRLTPPAGQTLESLHYTGGNIIDGVAIPYEGDMTLLEDEMNPGTYVGSIKIKHGQSITIQNIPEGTQYSVTEVEADLDGYITYTQGTQTGTVTGNVGIVIAYKNKKAEDMDLTLGKTVNGSAGDRTADWHFDIKLTPEEHVNLNTRYSYTGTKRGVITFVAQEDGSYLGTVTLKHNDKITIVGLPRGTKYDISEREENADNYTTNIEGQTTGALYETGNQVQFTNTKIGYYNLSVKKTVEGRLGDKSRNWDFDIVLTIPDMTDQTATYQYVKSTPNADGSIIESTGSLTFTKNQIGNYEARISLKHGETLTIQNIIEGTQYSVSEPQANQDGYSTTYDENRQGTIVDSDILVEYRNRFVSKLGLTINKQVRGSLGDVNRRWTFKITLTPPEGVELENPYRYTGSRNGNIIFNKNSDGTYTGTVSLKHNETITIEDLPEETKYVVEELEANQDGYTTSNNGKYTGELNVGNPDVNFVNMKLSKHDLTLEKIVEGRAGDKNREWTFEVTLIPDEGITLDNSYRYSGSKEGDLNLIRNADGTYTGTIKLKHGEKVTIKDLPEGTQYKVIEKEANQEGYETTNSNNTEGKLVDDNTPVLSFKNIKYAKKDLTVKKIVQGMYGDKNREWTFEITLTPGKYTPFNTTYSYTGSKSGNIEFVKNPDGTYTGKITLKHGEEIKIKDLMEETQYKVIELEANQEGYVTNVNGNYEGTITDNNILVEFINSNTPTIIKTVTKTNNNNNNSNYYYNGPIAYNKNISNPRTSDDIMQFIALFGLSVSLITISIIGIKKKKNNS